MCDETSILELFNQLCDLHLGPPKRVHRVQPIVTREQTKQRLKRAIFSVLLEKVFGQEKEHNDPSGTISPEIEGVLLQITKLRKQNLSQEANRLESLFHKITTDYKKDDNVQQCLRLLVALRECGNSSANENSQDTSSFCVPRFKDEEPLTRDGPVSYRMGMLPSTKGDHYYVQYPNDLFENVSAFNLREDERTVSWVFNSTPGHGISEDSAFAPNSEDKAIVSPVPIISEGFCDVNIRLDLLDFQASPDFKIPDFKCSKSRSFTQLSEVDSGQSSMSGSVVSVVDQAASPRESESVWDSVLTDVRSRHYTWEWIGYQPGPTERPYLTESGPQVFDVLVRHRLHTLSIAVPDFVQPPLIPVHPSTLTKNILHMLVGVQSWIFPFDETSQSFNSLPGLHTSGMSSDMMADSLKPFTQFGTFFRRLTQFTRPTDSGSSFYISGLVFKAFTAAIRTVLSHYSAAILKIPSTLTLLQLGIHLHAAFEQIGYLARLCQVHDQPPSHDPLVTNFPLGIKLLTYLYREAQTSSCCGHYPVLLSILDHTWTPFMLFVKDWVFHGIHNDIFKEFMIDVDFASLEKRDMDYWDKAYTLSQSVGHLENLPDFLQPVVRDIVTCGKSINLLRICSPQHFLCNVSDSVIPSVGISFSPTDLSSMEQYCQIYIQRMRQIARSVTEDRLEARKRVKRQKKELRAMAKKVAEQEIARLQGIIDERKRKHDVKKRIELKRLKEQMESDLERRAGNDEKEKEEDRNLMARMAKEEDALTHEEIELEERARDELIAYYAGLSEEAMHRERKALWKVQRARLDTSRVQFLMEDELKWKAEMEEMTKAKTMLDSVDSGGIPKWADRSSKDATIIVEENEEEVDLPQWARQISLPTSGLSPTTVATEGLPGWAARGIDGEMVEVNGAEKGEDGENDLEEDEIETEEMPKSSREFKAIQFGGPASQKPHIKMSDQTNVTTETAESESLPHTRPVEGKHISVQSEQSETDGKKMSIRKVAGVDMLKQSEEKDVRIHIKKSDTMAATTESEEVEKKSSIKVNDGISVNKQSTEERQIIPKRGRQLDVGHITEQTESQIWAVKKPSLFGHVSQLSIVSDSKINVPRLRRNFSNHASFESDLDFKDFGIKPRIRMSKSVSASTESVGSDTDFHSKIRFNVKQYANLESVPEDHQQIATARFRQINVKGHASDSTVQRLLYGGNEEVKENLGPLPRVELKAGTPYEVESYDSYFHLEDKPVTDLMSSLNIADFGRNYLDFSSLNEEEVEAYKYRPLSSLMTRAIASPVRAQISLIDKAVINYFTSELRVEDHLSAIRRYVFMADGDFAQILCDILNEKLATKPLPKEILNPVFLKGALTKAVRSSMHSDDPHAQRLSFRLVYMPSILMPNEPKSLKCLDLRYSVEWPMNIVFTESCMEKYSLVFGFLLQIKRVVWNLKDVWHRLKRDALINKAGNSAHFLQLQLHRQEMEHFVKMMQGYVTNQVIHVTWQELQTALAGDIAGLDELKAMHENYLQKAVCRCLLDNRASRVMQIILKIFCLILKFRTQLLSGSWERDDTGRVFHPSFDKMVETYKSFHAHSLFLFKVVHLLSEKGYQPHLQELLIQLNFNNFYTQAAK